MSKKNFIINYIFYNLLLSCIYLYFFVKVKRILRMCLMFLILKNQYKNIIQYTTCIVYILWKYLLVTQWQLPKKRFCKQFVISYHIYFTIRMIIMEKRKLLPAFLLVFKIWQWQWWRSLWNCLSQKHIWVPIYSHTVYLLVVMNFFMLRSQINVNYLK